MSVLISGGQLRTILFGDRVDATSYDLAVETHNLFTVSGLVAVTALWGYVSTAITVANTVKLTHDPTTGATYDLCSATDIGTTDTPIGDFLTVDGKASALARTVGAALGFLQAPLLLNTGTLTQITATGADGTIAWSLCYVPIDDGASVVAA